jgi:hypothetical protein
VLRVVHAPVHVAQLVVRLRAQRMHADSAQLCNMSAPMRMHADMTQLVVRLRAQRMHADSAQLCNTSAPMRMHADMTPLAVRLHMQRMCSACVLSSRPSQFWHCLVTLTGFPVTHSCIARFGMALGLSSAQ